MAPIINNVYPQLGPVGQGVVISGENFISNQIQVFSVQPKLLNLSVLNNTAK